MPKATSDETKRIKDRANANANRMQGQTPHKIRGIAKTTSNETKRIKDRENTKPNGNDICKLALQSVINRMEQTRETQENIDDIYTELCDVIMDEMNRKIPVFDKILNQENDLR